MATLTFDELMESLSSLTDTQLSTLNSSIVDTLRLRRKLAGRRLAAELEVGDMVRIKGSVRPQYLRGKTAKVLAFKSTRVEIQLQNGYMGKFARSNGKLYADPSLLEKIED